MCFFKSGFLEHLTLLLETIALLPCFSDLTVAAYFRLADKPAVTGGLTPCFLAEAQRTQEEEEEEEE